MRKEEYFNTGKIVIYANNLEINESRKKYTETKIQETDKNGITNDKLYITKEIVEDHPLKNEFHSNVYINYSENYKYLGKEKYNNKKCIKSKFILYGKDNYVIAWIDKETGFILKEENYKEGQLNSIVTYNTNINIVTDEDIIVPEIEEYTYYEKH